MKDLLRKMGFHHPMDRGELAIVIIFTICFLCGVLYLVVA